MSLSKYKKLLGKEANNLIDKKTEKIRDTQYRLVEIIFDI